jgi:protein SCO1
LGVQIVVGAILIAAASSLAWAARRAPFLLRAAEQLPPGSFPLGEFRLVERSGRSVSQTDLRGRIWVAGFIFTRCPLSCPRISNVMKDLQRRFDGTSVLLASITVDPDYDTPAVLAQYAEKFGARPDRWWFLAGSKEHIHALVQGRFKVALQEASPAEKAAGSEVITHSDRLALVEDGQVIGFFESSNAASLDALVAVASRRALPAWLQKLPALNASLNGLCAILLVVGWILIRKRSIAERSASVQSPTGTAGDLLNRPVVRAHIAVMLAAVGLSALFLTSYLVYHSQAGSTAFPHEGPLRVVYFTILLSHLTLAIAVVPLVATTLIRAIRRNYAGHLAVAQLTFPIWLYVSVTGVVIYVMLYHLPTQSSLSGVII